MDIESIIDELEMQGVLKVTSVHLLCEDNKYYLIISMDVKEDTECTTK